jgi:hypothetical protein
LAATQLPAVFFRHLLLVALSFPHGKIRRAFQECRLFFHFVELRKSENA